MKRSNLQRKTPLKQRQPVSDRPGKPLRARKPIRQVSAKARARKAVELPGEREWKAPHSGPCSACGRNGPLIRHHVVPKQRIRDPELKYALANAMEVGMWCPCHEKTHSYGVNDARFRIDQLPVDAVAFAYELLGGYAGDYLARLYQPTN